MSKGVTKKKNRKLRRQIRKTIGALLMVSAITVAAIPVQDVSANPESTETPKVAVTGFYSKISPTTEFKSTIPNVMNLAGKDAVIYNSGDGTYQFAYVPAVQGDINKKAVILRYNRGERPASSLEIPNSLEAYRKFSDNTSNLRYCLVSRNNEFLYYATQIQSTNDEGIPLYRVIDMYDQTNNNERLVVNQNQLQPKANGTGFVYIEKVDDTDDDDKPIVKEVEHEVEKIMEPYYNPCYYEKYSEWGDLEDEELYYKTGDSYSHPNGDTDYYKITAEVAYIGAEKIEENPADPGTWKLVEGEDRYIDEPSEGVFADQANITNLTIGEKLLGISDYAFQGCATLSKVTLGNGLETVGNGAFANCIRLSECNIANNANIKAFGKDAFYNCTSLTSFQVPIGMIGIGDSCFEGCISLQNIELCGGDGGNTMLNVIGNHAFKGCSSLSSLILPSQYYENLDINVVEGCRSLQYIWVNHKDFNFVESESEGAFKIEGFKSTVPDSFYIIGPLPKSEEDRGKSEIHKTANNNAIAFKYPDQELYEVVKEEKASAGSSPDPARITYQVNNLNELVDVWINGTPENITLPEKIGPYGISAIGKGSFNDSCTLKKITIPASVVSIGDDAFKGCHNLNTIIFTDASTVQSIGNDAFKTQVCSCGETLTDPKLTFVGAMMNGAGEDTVPFIYAMNGVSNINNPNQEKIWIKCHSGWPTNLEVQYKFDPLTNTGKAELVGYPRYDMIDSKEDAKAWVAALPYVTTENQKEYESMVEKATAYYKNPETAEQPTENEMAIIGATLHVVVPTSVDCIKPGLFSGYTFNQDGEPEIVGGGAIADTDTKLQSIVLNGVDSVDSYTFKGCTALKEAAVIGGDYIADYAFDECTALENATLGTKLTDTGKRPFRGCDKLTNISCLDSDFSYNNGVLYRHTGNGTEIVQCLETRGGIIGSYSVGPEEFAGVASMKEEAFADCGKIGKVDLSATVIDVIPEAAFKNTKDLNSVVLPSSVKNIEAESFRDSAIRLLTIPGSQAYIAPDAFATSKYLESKDHDDQQTIIFECIEGTTADRYAKQTENWYINPEYGKVYLEHTVYFWDYPDYPDTTNKTLFHKVKVKDGEDAVPPAKAPEHEGHPFSRWTDYTKIVRDTDVYPVFGSNIYTVKFLNWDGTQIGEVQYIEEGKSAVPPAEDPVREGYTFMGWLGDYHNITADMTILPDFRDNTGTESRHTVTFYGYGGTTVLDVQTVAHGDKARPPVPPVIKGYKFIGWAPSDFSNVTSDMTIVASYEKDNGSGGSGGSNGGSDKPKGSASPSPSASPSASPEVKKYTVSVSGGSGSGSYEAGAIVAVNAYFMGDGQSFDKWTSSTAGVGFANPNASSTTFTMPAANVAVTATYKTGTSGNTNTGTGGSNTGGGTSSNTGGGTSSNQGGTSVEVTKPGISNTNLAGATVSGATDNFIVKVTEDQNATDAVVGALQAKYGDISRIKYLPMDISLYDATGRTKIADTSGISVNLTLPIPDDLVQYAGNNRIAAVVNGSLEDLSARFTTVGGVPCINFTASHFSPYVIYVDTANLTEGTIDATPKTGDPIHPKWFLAMGMACISLILFFKKDKTALNIKKA